MICDCFSVMIYTDWPWALSNLRQDGFAHYKSLLLLLLLLLLLFSSLSTSPSSSSSSSSSFIIFSCDQAALRTLQSVRLSARPSVCLSVCDTFSPCSCHCIITKFSELITIGKSDVHAKGQGQRSKVKVTEVLTPLSRFWTVTPVGMHIWRRNDAQSLMLLRRGALLFFKVIRQVSRSNG